MPTRSSLPASLASSLYPTVHVWSGDLGRLTAHWLQRQRLEGVATIVVSDQRFPRSELLATIDRHSGLTSLAIGRLANDLHLPADSLLAGWQAMTVYDRKQLLARLPLSADRELIEFLSVQPQGWYRGPVEFDIRWFDSLQAWLGSTPLPRILYQTAQEYEFQQASRAAVAAAFESPALHQTILTSERVWQQQSATRSSSRFSTVLRENYRSFAAVATGQASSPAPAGAAKSLAPTRPQTAHSQPAISHAEPAPAIPSADSLTTVDDHDSLLHANAPAAVADLEHSLPPLTGQPIAGPLGDVCVGHADAVAESESFIDRARSNAEQQLYDWLQSDSRTRDLFRLNNLTDIEFGQRPMEVDLLCESLKIAIEVDGWFHFQDMAAYRRDRAKDWLLQTHGFWVLRFTTEDIPDQRASIQRRIHDTIQTRRQTR